jgi:hypothetical protein
MQRFLLVAGRKFSPHRGKVKTWSLRERTEGNTGRNYFQHRDKSGLSHQGKSSKSWEKSRPNTEMWKEKKGHHFSGKTSLCKRGKERVKPNKEIIFF